MKVVADSAVLLLLIDPSAPAPDAEEAVRAAGSAAERIEHFIDGLSTSATTLILPTPVLTELMTRAPEAVSDALASIRAVRAIQTAAFDELAALECAVMLRAKWKSARERSRAKVKFDHQIVSIAKVRGAEMLLTDDEDVAKLARRVGIRVLGIWDLPPPPRPAQHPLPFPATPA